MFGRLVFHVGYLVRVISKVHYSCHVNVISDYIFFIFSRTEKYQRNCSTSTRWFDILNSWKKTSVMTMQLYVM